MSVVVLLLEAALPGEPLTVANQVNEVVGPFSSVAEADRWLQSFRDRAAVAGEHQVFAAPGKIEYLITDLTVPA